MLEIIERAEANYIYFVIPELDGIIKFQFTTF